MGLKPMNCPAHIQVYAVERHSYRDLPIRFAEQGLVHRHEPSGALHGLMRVRRFTQDDAHIFCTPDQMEDEVLGCLDSASTCTTVRLRRRGWSCRRGPRTGSAPTSCGSAPRAALAGPAAPRADVQVGAGEGPFYGPKIDLQMTDAIGRRGSSARSRSTTCRSASTCLHRGRRRDHRPVMIHRALFGRSSASSAS